MLAGCSHGGSNQESACEILKRTDPSAAGLSCGGSYSGSSSKPQVSGPKSSLATRAILNPAMIPTALSAFGLETMIFGVRRAPLNDRYLSFSAIKGFGRAGAGMTTTSENTFYGNDVMQRGNRAPNIDHFYEGEDPKRRFPPKINLGASFSILPDSSRFNAKIGATAKYNPVTDTIGPGAGIGFAWNRFSVGLSATREKVSNNQDHVWLAAATASLQLPYLQLDYSFLKNYGIYRLLPVHIGTATFQYKRLIAFAAIRRLNYLIIDAVNDGLVVQKHWGIQYILNSKLALGFTYNYIPGANALVAQFFL